MTKPPKTYWTRMELETMDPNKFQEICDNSKKLNGTLGTLAVSKVQSCKTDEICDSCNSFVKDEKMGSEPVINIYEGIEAVSIRNYCFDNQSEEQNIFNIECFKEIPLLFRAFKEAHKLLDLTKSLHGSVSIDTLYWQNINKQVLWFTSIDDNLSTMSDADRQTKDVKDFIGVLFKLIFNNDT